MRRFPDPCPSVAGFVFPPFAPFASFVVEPAVPSLYPIPIRGCPPLPSLFVPFESFVVKAVPSLPPPLGSSPRATTDPASVLLSANSIFLCTFLRGYIDKPETGQDKPSISRFSCVPVFPVFLLGCPLGFRFFWLRLCRAVSIRGWFPSPFASCAFSKWNRLAALFSIFVAQMAPRRVRAPSFFPVSIFPLAGTGQDTYRDTGPGRHAEGISRHLRWMGEFSSFSSGPPRDHRSPPAAHHRKEMDP